MQKEFARWPQYEKLYMAAFDRMLEERKAQGKEAAVWQNGVDVFHWWIGDGVISGQISMDELEEVEHG